MLIKVDFRFPLFCSLRGRVSCYPAAELKHDGMCLLVAQTMASELRLGGGGHEDRLSRLTFH